MKRPYGRGERRIMMMVGKKLKQLRKRINKEQEDIATVVGFNRATVSNWESGKATFTIARLPAVARAYGFDDPAEFIRYVLSDDAGEEAWRVPTGNYVRFSGEYYCERCGDLHYLRITQVAPPCERCGSTVWKRKI